MAAGKVKNVAGQPHFQGTHPTMFRRFSLRTLLIITTLAALLFGYIVWFEAPSYNPRQRQQEYLEKQLLNGGDSAVLSGGAEWRDLPNSPFQRLFGRKRGRRIDLLGITVRARPSYNAADFERTLRLIDDETTILRIDVTVAGKKTLDDSVQRPPKFRFPRHTAELYLSHVLIDEQLLQAMETQRVFTDITLIRSPFETIDLHEANRRFVRTLSPQSKWLHLEYVELSSEGMNGLGEYRNIDQVLIQGCEFVRDDGKATRRLPAEIIPLSVRELYITRQELDAECLKRLKFCNRLHLLRFVECNLANEEANKEFLELLKMLPQGIRTIAFYDLPLDTRHVEALTRYQELSSLDIEHYGPTPSLETIAQLSDALWHFSLEADDLLGWTKGLVQKPLLREYLTYRYRSEAPDEVMEVLMKAKRTRFSAEDGVFSNEAMALAKKKGFFIGGYSISNGPRPAVARTRRPAP